MPLDILNKQTVNGKITWEEIGEISLKEKQEAEAGLRCKGCWDHGYNLSWVDEGGFPVSRSHTSLFSHPREPQGASEKPGAIRAAMRSDHALWAVTADRGGDHQRPTYGERSALPWCPVARTRQGAAP
jgi:hypothetical protein